MSYKLVKEHESTFEVKHPEGKTFHVAKNALSQGLLSKIKAMPMAYGGEVTEDMVDAEPELMQEEPIVEMQNRAPAGMSQPSEAPSIPGMANLGTMINEPAPEQMGPAMPTQDQMAMSQPAPTQGRIFGPGKQPERAAAAAPVKPQADLSSQLNSAIGMEARGIKEEAQAEADKARASVGIMEAFNKQMQEAKVQYDTKLARIDAENKQLSEDVLNYKLNPNRVWSNMSTGNKVLAGIGIVLSGIGSGIAKGQPNMAMNILDDLQKADIDLQKAELGKKETLLSANLRKYGDLNTATQATMLQLNSIMQGQLAQSAAKTGSAMAQARAKQAIGALEMKAIPLRQDIAKKDADKQVIKMLSGDIKNMTGADLAALPKEVHDRIAPVLVPGEGLASSPDGAKTARDSQSARNSALPAIDKIIKLRKEYGTEFLNRNAVTEAKGLAVGLQGALRTLITGPGAVSDTERKLMEELMEKDPLSVGLDSTMIKKYETLRGIVERKYQADLQAAGVKRGNQLKNKEGAAQLK